jgi:hypothetical protein
MDDFENALRRFRPAGPPPELRDRVVAAAGQRVEPSGVRAREWMATAAVLALTVVFYWLAANERRIVGAMFTPVPPIEEAARMSMPLEMQEPQ